MNLLSVSRPLQLELYYVKERPREMGPGHGNISCTIKRRTRGRKSKKMKNLPRDLPCWWSQKTEEKTNKQTKRGINVKKMKSLVLREEQPKLGLHLGSKAGKRRTHQ